MEISNGDKIGRYLVVDEIGRGGAAVVYQAMDTTPELERYVALKMMLWDIEKSDKFMKRFQREAKVLAQLSHPSIVRVLDYGEHEETPFLVMEYVPNGSLLSRMGPPFSADEAAALLLPIARALEHAHKKNVVHRDIKPANILINNAGQPMLSDFGIARLMNVEESQALTGTGAMIGTPAYMAPEQIQGELVDGRADIYALGILFFELVTSRKPYIADTPIEMALKHLHDPLPRPRQMVRSLPISVEQVILKATAKKPHDRFQDMGHFAHALEKISSGVKWDGKIDKKYEEAANTNDGGLRSRRKISLYYGIGGILLAMATAAIFLLSNFCPPFIPSCVAIPNPIIEPTATSTVTITPSLTVTTVKKTEITATLGTTPTVTFTPVVSTPTVVPTVDVSGWIIEYSFDFPIHSMDWAPDGKTIVVGGTEKITSINAENYSLSVISLNKNEVVEDIFFVNDSSEVVARIGNSVRFYNLDTNAELARFEGNDYTGLMSISVSNDRKYLALGRSNKNVKVIDAVEKRVIWWTDNSFFSNNKVAIVTSAEGERYLATATSEGVMLWKWIKVNERFEKQTIDSLKQNFETIAFSSDGKFLVAGTETDVLMWSIGSKEPKQFRNVSGHVRVVQFLPGDNTVAFGYKQGGIRFYDPFSLERTFSFPNRSSQEIKGIKFPPSLDAMVSGSTEGVWIWAAP
jgi:serine/threonine protein kinase